MIIKKGILEKLIACKLSKFSILFLLHISYILLYNIPYYSFIDIYIIDFQKRGLPHAYILIFFHPSHKHPSPIDIDKITSAEIPYPWKESNLVKTHMVHGPCGLTNKSSPCMKEGKCYINIIPKSTRVLL